MSRSHPIRAEHHTDTDCTIVGVSFAGLACATSLAHAGLRVTVLEKKADAGAKLHTTGPIVKERSIRSRLLDRMPAELVRRVAGVKRYAPKVGGAMLDGPLSSRLLRRELETLEHKPSSVSGV